MAFDPTIPAYVSPLTDSQHAQLGRIAVLWGFADFFLDVILEKAVGLTREQHNTLVRDKSFGAKLDILKAHLPAIADEDARTSAKVFREMLNNTKQRRNQAFHGAWGWRGVEGKELPEICARHHATPHNPIKASDLGKLETELCNATAFGRFAMAKLHLLPPLNGVTRFMHGEGENPPELFLQWIEQHPLDAANLDHSCKAGELPRLTDPMK